MKKLFMPETLKVGFQRRTDTFDGKLSFIIYYDEKNILRKEQSWNSWRNESIEPIDIKNVPTKGFIINKSIQRHNYHFGSGRNMTRVYDPRGFEFEISADNLHGIIDHSNILMNEIEVECVYAWDKTDLILLPVNSQQYKDSVVHTNKRNAKSISAKELVVGCEYSMRKEDKNVIYLGKHIYTYDNDALKKYYNALSCFNYPIYRTAGKVNVFYDQNKENFITIQPSELAECINKTPDRNIDNIINEYLNSKNGIYIEKMEVDVKFDNKDVIENRKAIIGTIEKIKGEDVLSMVGGYAVISNRSKHNSLRISKSYFTTVKKGLPQLSIGYDMEQIIKANTGVQELSLNRKVLPRLEGYENKNQAYDKLMKFMKKEGFGVIRLTFSNGTSGLLESK